MAEVDRRGGALMLATLRSLWIMWIAMNLDSAEDKTLLARTGRKGQVEVC